MSLKVAIQMDPIGPININADSTFRIAEEAQSRGYSLFYYTPDKLAYQEGKVTARGWPLTVQRVQGNHFTLGEEQEVDLSTFDVVWLRQDPPFDMGYITTTHILDMIHPKTLVVNDPFWVRNYPEKLLVLNFPDLTPPTMIARDLETLKSFRAKHGDVILKPLYGNGGAGVFKLSKGDGNLASLHELFSGINREPLIMQKFLPDVAKGDKRVILVDGEPVGAINRVPAKGETRSNMHVGGLLFLARGSPLDLSGAVSVIVRHVAAWTAADDVRLSLQWNQAVDLAAWTGTQETSAQLPPDAEAVVDEAEQQQRRRQHQSRRRAAGSLRVLTKFRELRSLTLQALDEAQARTHQLVLGAVSSSEQSLMGTILACAACGLYASQRGRWSRTDWGLLEPCTGGRKRTLTRERNLDFLARGLFPQRAERFRAWAVSTLRSATAAEVRLLLRL